MLKFNALAAFIASAGVALAAVALPVAGQNRDPEQQDQDREPINRTRNDGKPAPAPKPPASPAPKPPDKPDSSTPSKPESSARGGGAANDDTAEHSDGRMNPKAAQKKILLEEGKYRDQMARITRLRQLATQQGNQQRLAALDKLEDKMTELHERKIAAARAAMGDQDFDKLNKELQKGRGRGNGAEKTHGKSDKNRPDNNGAGKGKDNGDDRGKPDNAGPPSNPGSSAPGRGNSDRGKNANDSNDNKGGKPANAGGGKGKP